MSLHAALAKQRPRSTAGAGERAGVGGQRSPGRRPRSVYSMGQQPTATVCQGQQRQRVTGVTFQGTAGRLGSQAL